MKVYISLCNVGGLHSPFWYISKYRRASAGHQYLHSNGVWFTNTGTGPKPTGRFSTQEDAKRTAVGFGYEPVTD